LIDQTAIFKESIMQIELRRIFSFITIILLSQTAFSKSHPVLANYNELLTALTDGDTVRAIISLDKCKPSISNVDAGNVQAGLNFTNYNRYKITDDNGELRETIATSTSLVTQHHQYGNVIVYSRLRIFTDNTASLFTQWLDPKSYATLSSVTFRCDVGDGKAIALFKFQTEPGA